MKETASTLSDKQNNNTTTFNENKTTTTNGTTQNKTTTKNKTAQNTNSTIVYVTKTGSKYHKANCSYLKNSKIEMTLTDAKAQGYTPCSKCY